MVIDSNPKLIVGLGELLWDLLPAGPQLGGAAANFAVMAARLGDQGVCASRLGRQELGRRAVARLAELPVDTGFLQTDDSYLTGSATVELKDGQPQFVIHYPVAWDFFELTSEWLKLAERAEAVCFGTLAQRSPVSRETIQGFLAATSPECARVFDVNLRAPFYSPELIESSLKIATLTKLNDAEMPLVLELLGLPRQTAANPADALLAGARTLLERFPLKLVCVTMGERGSLLVTPDAVDRHPGIPTKVADTVGAGDAFTAALTHYYLRQAPLAVLNEAGNRWGSWVASQPGAMPPLDDATFDSITGAILSRKNS
jgi:fructokinase